SPLPSGSKPRSSSTKKSSGSRRIAPTSAGPPCANGKASASDTEHRTLTARREQHDGLRGDPLAAAGGAELLGRRRLDAHLARIATEVGGQICAHRVSVRGDPRRLADDGDVGVAERETGIAHQLRAVAQEQPAVRAAPARVRWREVPAYVAERER